MIGIGLILMRMLHEWLFQRKVKADIMKEEEAEEGDRAELGEEVPKRNTKVQAREDGESLLNEDGETKSQDIDIYEEFSFKSFRRLRKDQARM